MAGYGQGHEIVLDFVPDLPIVEVNLRLRMKIESLIAGCDCARLCGAGVSFVARRQKSAILA